MTESLQIDPLAPLRAPSVSDQVFHVLHDKILTCSLPPLSKLSEADVAQQMGISRQPVREAFFRLSQLGFLQIRPQRATIVRPISIKEVLQAMYIRRALEAEVVGQAVQVLDQEGLGQLSDLLGQQAEAAKEGDKIGFHQLDDAFHQQICEANGTGFVWTLIKQKKAHMDRVRYLTLSFSVDQALAEHRAIFEALAAPDRDAAIARMRAHLGKIEKDLPRLQAEHEQYFAKDEDFA